MSTEIIRTSAHPRNSEWLNLDIERDGRPEKAIAFRGIEALKPGPLPEGWTVEEGKYGPVLNPPAGARGSAQGGGRPAAGFRGTEAGFKFEQNQMNKRTALMQAVALVKEPGQDVYTEADKMFKWLQQS